MYIKSMQKKELIGNISEKYEQTHAFPSASYYKMDNSK